MKLLDGGGNVLPLCQEAMAQSLAIKQQSEAASRMCGGGILRNYRHSYFTGNACCIKIKGEQFTDPKCSLWSLFLHSYVYPQLIH